MVGFLFDTNGVEEVEEDIKNQPILELKKENDPFGLAAPELDEFSFLFTDSFLDFDSMEDLISESPTSEQVELGSEEVQFSDTHMVNEVGLGGVCLKVEEEEEKLNLEQSKTCFIEKGFDNCNESEVKIELPICGKVGDIGCLIEEEMEKVSIRGESDDCPSNFVNSSVIENEIVTKLAGNGAKIEGDLGEGSIVNGSETSDEVAISSRDDGNTGKIDASKGEEEGSNSDIKSETKQKCLSSSSSSSASSSDEEEEDSSEASETEADIEEGEIPTSDAEEMVAWSEDEDETGGIKGPIMSKNEIQALPPVPPVNVTLLPNQETVPVGEVSSILGAQVVVEGDKMHNPLNDGSILWITESRIPLGIVDEIFGPVEKPYYIVRYNCETEVPTGIHKGTLISFVPEFANHVLNDGNLYKKGYDASGENDEEVSVDEEFSDDEKEAEHKRMLKMKKRETNDQKLGNKKNNKKKFKNQSQNYKHDQAVATGTQPENGKPPADQSRHFIPPVAGSPNPCSHPSSSFQGQASGSRPALVPSFPHMQQAPGFAAPSSGMWTNGIPCQQPQGMGYPNTFPTMGMPWPQHNPQQMYQMPLPNAVPFQQQNNLGLPPNFVLPSGQQNFSIGQAFAPWPALGQNGFYQPPFGMGGLPGQMPNTPISFGGQAPVNRPQTGHNNNSQSPATATGNNNGSQNFNQSNHFGMGGIPGQLVHTPISFGGQAPVNRPQTGHYNNSRPPAASPGNNNVSPNFNQGNHFGMGGSPGQSHNPISLGGQAPMNGPQTGHDINSHPPADSPGNDNGSQNLNQSNHFGGGRRGNRRGGGRFGRGRGRGKRG